MYLLKKTPGTTEKETNQDETSHKHFFLQKEMSKMASSI
jgi:hypothetical protein